MSDHRRHLALAGQYVLFSQILGKAAADLIMPARSAEEEDWYHYHQAHAWFYGIGSEEGDLRSFDSVCQHLSELCGDMEFSPAIVRNRIMRDPGRVADVLSTACIDDYCVPRSHSGFLSTPDMPSSAQRENLGPVSKTHSKQAS
jgi:hypothetical protein